MEFLLLRVRYACDAKIKIAAKLIETANRKRDVRTPGLSNVNRIMRVVQKKIVYVVWNGIRDLLILIIFSKTRRSS